MKRIFAILAVALLLLLAACNPKPKDTDTTGTDTGGTSGTDTKTGAGAGFTVKIGFNFEETGKDASFGQSSRKGAEMALEELASVPDMPKFEAAWGDNASDSTQAATVASKLINDDKANILVGCVASSNSFAEAKIAEEAGIPVVTPASTNTKLTLNADSTVRPLIFRTCFIDDFQGTAMLDFCITYLKASKIAIFFDADSDYSIGIKDTIKSEAAKKSISIVAEDSFLATSETDFRTKLNRLKAQKFDVLIVPGYYGAVAQIANQAREVGITVPMVGGDGWDSPDLWKNAGKNIEGCFFTNHYAADDQDPAVQDFISKFKARNGGNTPDAMAILAYDAVMAVADAYKRAGSNDATKFSEAMAATSGFKAASGTLTIDPSHNASKKLVVVEITPGGTLKWVYSFDPSGAGGATNEQPTGSASPNGEADTSAPSAARPNGGM